MTDHYQKIREQPEALRLADALDYDPMPMGWYLDAAAELRRLHAENERLRAAIKKLTRKQSLQVCAGSPGVQAGVERAIDEINCFCYSK